MKMNRFEQLLRHAPVPVVGRVEGDRLFLDIRTIADDELGLLVESLQSALAANRLVENEMNEEP
jgi:L-seryl-tRNA(Ser) seleniumtransferase